MATPTVRSRRPFHYPDEDASSDDDDTPSIMDEQGTPLPNPPSLTPPSPNQTNPPPPPGCLPEQESYIRTLTTLNTTRNTHFTHLLLLLPLLASIPPLLALLRTTQPPLLPLLALTSLAATAYLLLVLPPTKTGVAAFDFRNGNGSGSGDGEGGPLARYLPYLVPVLAAAVAVGGRVRGAGGGEGWWLPAGVHLATVVGKLVMGGVDPGELEGLRYGYKGA